MFRCIFTTLYRRYSSNGDSILRQQHYDDQYDHYRDYWQRPAFGTRIFAGRSGTQASLHAWPQGKQVFSTSADVHHDDAYYWRFRNDDHSTGSLWPGGQSTDERPVPPPRRRALKNLQYSVDTGLVQAFELPFSKTMEKDQTINNYDLTPSNQTSARGSFRSDGSGQSQVRRPFSQLSYTGSNARAPSEVDFGTKSQFLRSTLHSSLPLRPQTLMPFHQRQITSISNQSQDSKTCISSPTPLDVTFPHSSGNFSREFNFINPASIDSRNFESSRLNSKLRELPSLRPIHEQSSRQDHLLRTMAQPFYRANHEISSLRATVPIGRSQFTGRAFSRVPLLEPVPEAIYDSATALHRSVGLYYIHNIIHSLIFYCLDGRIREDQFNPYQNLPLTRQFVSSPVEIISSTMIHQPIRRPLPIHPVSSISYNKDPNVITSSDSSSEQFEYTRDKLIGAVEKVRSGYLLSRSSPYRHTIEGNTSSVC